jgi:hypothetical protein
MQNAQKHHYIPIFYLKQWTGADHRLCEYSRPYDLVKPRRCFPSQSGFEYGLYTLSTYPNTVADIVERKLFQATDDWASRALRLLLDNNIDALDASLRSGWARFIISLMRRTPEAVKDLADKLRTSLSEIDELRALPGDPKKEQRDQMLQGLVEQRQALLLQELLNSDLVGGRLVNMRWAVVRFDRVRYPLLTSDRPFVMTNGIGHADSHIAVPISPDQCFVAVASMDVERQLKAIPAEKFMLILNDKMVRQARKFVYGVDDTQLRFVANRFGKKELAGPGDV